VPISRVIDVGMKLLELGRGQLFLGDTIGVDISGHLTAFLTGLAQARIGSGRQTRIDLPALVLVSS
jgi:hydroxymethylglutaryl-CoA lyase